MPTSSMKKIWSKGKNDYLDIFTTVVIVAADNSVNTSNEMICKCKVLNYFLWQWHFSKLF